MLPPTCCTCRHEPEGPSHQVRLFLFIVMNRGSSLPRISLVNTTASTLLPLGTVGQDVTVHSGEFFTSITQTRTAGNLKTAPKIRFHLSGGRSNSTLCGYVGISGHHVRRNWQCWAKAVILNAPLCSSGSCSFVFTRGHNVSGNLVTTELGKS
jgi:hypothetical protein